MYRKSAAMTIRVRRYFNSSPQKFLPWANLAGPFSRCDVLECNHRRIAIFGVRRGVKRNGASSFSLAGVLRKISAECASAAAIQRRRAHRQSSSSSIPGGNGSGRRRNRSRLRAGMKLRVFLQQRIAEITVNGSRQFRVAALEGPEVQFIPHGEIVDRIVVP